MRKYTWWAGPFTANAVNAAIALVKAAAGVACIPIGFSAVSWAASGVARAAVGNVALMTSRAANGSLGLEQAFAVAASDIRRVALLAFLPFDNVVSALGFP